MRILHWPESNDTLLMRCGYRFIGQPSDGASGGPNFLDFCGQRFLDPTIPLPPDMEFCKACLMTQAEPHLRGLLTRLLEAINGRGA